MPAHRRPELGGDSAGQAAQTTEVQRPYLHVRLVVRSTDGPPDGTARLGESAMSDGNRWTQGGWRSPAGISSIAGVIGVVITLAALLVGTRPGPEATPPTVAPSSSAAGTYVFVYGTTMPGHLRYPLIENFVAEATRDTASGRLYDSGAGYPAATFGAGLGTIEGYRLRLRPDRAHEALRTFTEMEAGLFHPTTVTTGGGIEATAYEWIGSTEGLPRLTGMWSGQEA
jgi:gamma-glutamylcyclotransferase (GGCT)/AIG2-like uncharacterized protein YtfP